MLELLILGQALKPDTTIIQADVKCPTCGEQDYMTIHRYREQALYRLGEFILVGPMTVGVCDCCRKVAFVVPIYEPDLLSRLRYLSEQDV